LFEVNQAIEFPFIYGEEGV
jgi:hypothetical protein